MTSMAAKLTKEHLEQIAGYLVERFPVLNAPARGKKSGVYDPDTRERVIRVEESLNNQQVILEKMLVQMDKRFEQIDKRFEQVDKRFEQVEKRFEQIDKRFEQVDRRFEEMRSDMNFRFEQVDKRFEQVDRKFTMIIWFMGFGFTIMTAFITGFMAMTR